MKLPRFPFVIFSRKRFNDIVATATIRGHNDGYLAALALKAELGKSRKAITKPKKARP